MPQGGQFPGYFTGTWTGPVTFSGTLTVNGTTTVASGDFIHTGSTVGYFGATGGSGYDLRIRGAAGFQRGFTLWTGGNRRWIFIADTTAEGGGNAGSNLQLGAYDDTGAMIDNPVTIVRASGGAIAAGGSSLRPLIMTGAFGSKVYTVGTLPTGGTINRAMVSDALAPVFGSAVVGGGAVTVPVYYTGTAWFVG
jgi:hypothetical protein